MSLNLDLTNVVVQGGPIPAGKYNCVIEKAEVAATKTGGEMIKVQLRVLDQGAYFGCFIFDQFNIKNANPQAVQIGLSQLKTLLKAAGFANPNKLNSTVEMQGLKVVVSTKVMTSPEYGEQTKVKGYEASLASKTLTDVVVEQRANANPFA